MVESDEIEGCTGGGKSSGTAHVLAELQRQYGDDVTSILKGLDIEADMVEVTSSGLRIDLPEWRPATKPLLDGIESIPGVSSVEQVGARRITVHIEGVSA